MKRRALLATLAAAPLASPGLTRSATRPIGWISIEPSGSAAEFLTALRTALASVFPGADQPQVIDRNSGADPAAIAASVKELQDRGVSLIVSQGAASPLVVRAKPAVPVVFAFSGDPVVAGMVDSLARPGGNATGMTFLSIELSAKRLGLAREVVPGCHKVALFSNRRHPGEEKEIAAVQEAVQKIGVELSVHRMETQDEATAAARQALDAGTQAVLALSSGGMLQQMPAIAAAFAERKVPVISGWASFARRGAVMSYGPNLAECYRRIGWYVARVLGGAAPSTLPIEQPSAFELVINRKTAEALGLALPVTLMAQANEVIE
jgi:putative ABC transport system substrate-binding protein